MRNDQSFSSVNAPLWLLDVDGVLNAVTSTPDPTVWDDWQRGEAHAQGSSWPICFSPTVMRTIRRLSEGGFVDIRWLTTWKENANGDLLQLLGLPAFRVAGADVSAEASPSAVAASAADGPPTQGAAVPSGRQGGKGWWKFDIVRELVQVAPNRPLIWTDDDLRVERDAVTWVRDHAQSNLVLAPPSAVGLTPRQLRRIEEFCTGHGRYA